MARILLMVSKRSSPGQEGAMSHGTRERSCGLLRPEQDEFSAELEGVNVRTQTASAAATRKPRSADVGESTLKARTLNTIVAVALGLFTLPVSAAQIQSGVGILLTYADCKPVDRN